MTSPASPPTMTAAPPAPDRSDRATFSPRATAWADFQKDTLVPEVQVAINNAFTNATSAHESAVAADGRRVAAAASAAAAQTAATQSAQYAGAVTWVAGSYATDAVAASPSTGLAYRRKAPGGSSPTDPALDPTNWRLAVIAAPLYREETGATVTGEVNVHHGLARAGVQNVNLPAPGVLQVGDVIWVSVLNGRADNYFTLNGAKVNGEIQSGDVLVIDDPFANVMARWTGATFGWSI